MADREPVTELDVRYGDPDAGAVDWAEGRRILEEAEIYWLSTVRPDGRPHVTPLIGVWLDGALHFTTGAAERKALNLRTNRHCVLTTGCNTLGGGFDVVVEGDAIALRQDDALTRLAAAYEAKYGAAWHFDVRDGVFVGEGGEALVFQVRPATAFGFGKGHFSQTRWRFPPR